MAEKIGLKAFRTIGSRMGLRKAAARRLAEAGWTTPKIMAITGHKSLQVVERYLRETTQERSAPAAIRKLERRTGAKGSQNPSRVCKNSEKSVNSIAIVAGGAPDRRVDASRILSLFQALFLPSNSALIPPSETTCRPRARI
jgi:hypothetical protein